MRPYETVLFEVSDSVATITLNRPEARNALNTQLRADLLQAVRQADQDSDVRVVIINATGKGFCAGADLSEEMNSVDGFITQQLREEYAPCLLTIADSKKPFIAVVNGAAAGIGAALVMNCSLAIMAEDAFLYSAFGAISLIPDGGCHWHLANRIGAKKAYEIILESQRLSAQQCLEWGLVNKVVDASVLQQAARDWALKLAQVAPLTARYSKEVLLKVTEHSLRESMDLEAVLQNNCICSEDFTEGSTAFFEKRAAKFKGK